MQEWRNRETQRTLGKKSSYLYEKQKKVMSAQEETLEVEAG